MHAVYHGRKCIFSCLFSLLIDLPLGSFPFPHTNLRREKRRGGGRSFFVLVLPAAAAEVKEEGVWFGWSEGGEGETGSDGWMSSPKGRRGIRRRARARSAKCYTRKHFLSILSSLAGGSPEPFLSLRQEEEEEERWRERERQEISSPFPLGSTSLCLRDEAGSLSLFGAWPVTVQRRRRRRVRL